MKALSLILAACLISGLAMAGSPPPWFPPKYVVRFPLPPEPKTSAAMPKTFQGGTCATYTIGTGGGGFTAPTYCPGGYQAYEQAFPGDPVEYGQDSLGRYWQRNYQAGVTYTNAPQCLGCYPNIP